RGTTPGHSDRQPRCRGSSGDRVQPEGLAAAGEGVAADEEGEVVGVGAVDNLVQVESDVSVGQVVARQYQVAAAVGAVIDELDAGGAIAGIDVLDRDVVGKALGVDTGPGARRRTCPGQVQAVDDGIVHVDQVDRRDHLAQGPAIGQLDGGPTP